MNPLDKTATRVVDPTQRRGQDRVITSILIFILLYFGGYGAIRFHCHNDPRPVHGGLALSVLPSWDILRVGTVLSTIYQPLFQLESLLFHRAFLRIYPSRVP